MVQCHFGLIEIWCDTTNNVLSPLIKLQKRVIRIICKARYNSNIESLFRRLQIYTVKQLYEFKMFSLSHRCVCDSLCKIELGHVHGVHDHHTRRRGIYKISTRTNMGLRNLKRKLGNYFNELPITFKLMPRLMFV
jgi:hypothetical protein